MAQIECGKPSLISFPTLEKDYELVGRYSEGSINIEQTSKELKYSGNLTINNHYRSLTFNSYSSGGNANIKFDNEKAKRIEDKDQKQRFLKIEKRKDCRMSRGIKCITEPERMVTIIEIDSVLNELSLSYFRMSHDVYQDYKRDGETALPKSYSHFIATYNDCSGIN
ncbi:MAG: hypothetical protein COW01_05175 [Bdellovibrionales bacterium CG12_big_fil_rev_8_21_14_0_65_38_15]|nr:MAG: hypothetical protein COW79_14455 [Bdellovibrionales bacterium CG22_combo_CG10-13_8_21_14_all_38_13]PIQ56275.1 MAG: hypothetical protein COW01_05175 [Bdellovibrionales bacterium CG12_big_fil_rev_8_21_14_0_65_38_15]PIR30419.1 MAG: hypothetical protein COV38_06620 [Bdellovibrionales bacterium CG11_big_fil_rev_8_21_14_0_20_38_13]